jgi:hypothetical protein
MGRSVDLEIIVRRPSVGWSALLFSNKAGRLGTVSRHQFCSNHIKFLSLHPQLFPLDDVSTLRRHACRRIDHLAAVFYGSAGDADAFTCNRYP